MRATDWCRSSAGAVLVLATSSDAEHPAESVADGNSETFWTTTGMFPQEFIIGFPKCVKISKVAIQCYLVRTLRIERSVSKDPVGFEQCIEKDLQHTEGQLQMEEFPLPEFQATYLRFIIKSAFDHFVSVHRVMAEGTAENA
ncbi:intraflagellar transport protein 25 homolog [Chiroxiphia lanceolata]|uniref:intraflagellar transport protein 25 homolog n=1 Tax=Corapipo altera TaxID=415028 RepID=UPI000FD62B5F|nr:intraflagellar transport protein 25 homolog [Corapipo altera]XP_032552071.1 intraflagellar transport protein 25 homolog [Chiroxiphia lanceolata]